MKILLFLLLLPSISFAAITIPIGGTSAKNDNYLGQKYEITVNSDNNSIRVHNGTTRGGFVITAGTCTYSMNSGMLNNLNSSAYVKVNTTDTINGSKYFLNNVGIGKTSASERLDISGNALITGNVGIGTTLLSDVLNISNTSAIMRCNDGTKIWRIGANGGNFIVRNESDTNTPLTITPAGYVKIGATSPSVRLIKLSTTTAAMEGGVTSIAHGVTGGKILTWTVKVVNSANAGMPPEFVNLAGYQYSTNQDGTNINVRLHATNSENILSKDVIITIWYEE